MRALGTRAIALATLLLTSGCGKQSPELEGSLSLLVDLHYRQADVTMTEDELSLRFFRPQGEGEDTVLKVSANLFGTLIDAREPLDLSEKNPKGEVRGKVTRDVLDDPRHSFPALERGQVVFDTVLTPGKKVTGSFNVTFQNGTEFACGRTVFADFEATVP